MCIATTPVDPCVASDFTCIRTDSISLPFFFFLLQLRKCAVTCVTHIIFFQSHDTIPAHWVRNTHGFLSMPQHYYSCPLVTRRPCNIPFFSRYCAQHTSQSTHPAATCAPPLTPLPIPHDDTRGDGRAVPRELDRKTADAAEVDLRLEEIGMGGIGQ